MISLQVAYVTVTTLALYTFLQAMKPSANVIKGLFWDGFKLVKCYFEYNVLFQIKKHIDAWQGNLKLLTDILGSILWVVKLSNIYFKHTTLPHLNLYLFTPISELSNRQCHLGFMSIEKNLFPFQCIHF